MLQITVQGMGCASCAAKITRAIQALDADATVQVDLARARVSISSQADAPALVAAISALGYQARLPA